MLRSPIRGTLVATGLVVSAGLLIPAVSAAHPLGNFSINHLARVSVSADRVDVRYILDEAEIPTFQQRGEPDATVLARKQAEVQRKLVLTVDGRRLALRPAGRATIAHPAGRGAEDDPDRAPAVRPRRGPAARRVARRQFPGRVGWKAIVAGPGRGTAVRSSVPAGDPTNGLRVYPADLLKSPSDVRRASLTAAPGAGTLSAPDGSRTVSGSSSTRAEQGLTKVFGDAAAGKGVLLLLLLAAFGWGAVHALCRGTGRRWSRRTWSARAGGRGTPSRSARS